MCFFFVNFYILFSIRFSDFVYTSIGIPGVYPPPIQIPNIPVPTGISEGNVGSNYNQTITVIVLQDTTLRCYLFYHLPRNAMNLAGISTVMNVGVNYITFDIQGPKMDFLISVIIQIVNILQVQMDV